MAVPLRVLILEDSTVDAELMLHQLRQTGFEPRWQRVETEADFRAALKPGLEMILSDQRLPQFNGLEALRLASASGLNIPFIIVSGAIDEESAVAFLKQGACDYVLKDRLTRLGPAVVHALENKILRERAWQLEEAREHPEEPCRQILETTVDPFVSLDEGGRVRFWNAQAEAVFGWSRAEALGQALIELIMPQRFQEAQQQDLRRLVQNEAKCRLDITARNKAGQEFPVEMTVWATRHQGQRCCHIFLRDNSTSLIAVRLESQIQQRTVELARRNQQLRAEIEERTQAEQALRQSEERFRRLAEELDGVVFSVELDPFRVIYFSSAAERFWQMSSREYEQNPFGWLEKVHADDKPRVQEHMQQLFQAGEEFQFAFEFRVAGPDGQTRWIYNHGNILKDADGRRRLTGLSEDITIRKEMEESLRRANEELEEQVRLRTAELATAKEAIEAASAYQQASEALRQSEQRYRWLAENTTDLVTIVDREGRILYDSPSSLRVLGLPENECLGRNAFELVHPEDLGDVLAIFAQVAAVPGHSAHKEVRYRHADGSWRILDVVAVNRLNDPIIDGILLCSRDITERRRLEEQMSQTPKMEALGRLAGGIAHDFNNLLTVINGYSELLLGSLEPGTPQHELLHNIKLSGERAAIMTQQLLAFSRKQILQPRVFDLNQLIQNSAKILRRLIGEDIELLTELDPALGTIYADPGQIDQVLLNLAVNARDAMPGGGSLTLSTQGVVFDQPRCQGAEAIPAGRYARLVVRDSGCGMTAEVLQQLFEPFFTTKAPGRGTGLGLATVQDIVRKNGGYLLVDSALGCGTAFTIFLPVTDLAADNLQAVVTRPPESAVARGQTILLVEDETNVRALSRLILEARGYLVLEAEDADKALAAAAQHPGPIHLLITDVVMPGLDGRQLAAQLLPTRPEMRVLFISGHLDDTLRRKGVLGEDMNLLPKPFTATLLAQKVREVLGQASGQVLKNNMVLACKDASLPAGQNNNFPRPQATKEPAG